MWNRWTRVGCGVHTGCAYPQGLNANGAPEGAPFTEEEGYRARWKSGGHPFGATMQYFPTALEFQTNTNSISAQDVQNVIAATVSPLLRTRG